MFELASRLKLRFEYRGLLSVEDLWDLSFESLDELFQGLNEQAKAQRGKSLLRKKSKADEELTLKIDIVKHVFSVKQDEAEQRKVAVANKQLHQKLLSIKADRQDQAYRDLSDKDLEKLINETA